MNSRRRQTIRVLHALSRPHRRHLLAGVVAAFGVVGMRLALPWPFKAIIQPWLADGGGGSAGVSNVLWLGVLFLGLVVALGLFDLLARLAFARFAIGTIRDLRAAAFREVAPSLSGSGDRRGGDLVARLIGDAARVKVGIKGLLIHVVTNGILFVGLTVLWLWFYPPLALIFAVSGLILCVVVVIGASRIYTRAARYRSKEGKLAERIHRVSVVETEAARIEEINASSGRHEASLTRIQGVTTWVAHGIFGLTVLALMGTAVWAVEAGRVDPGILVVLAMYSLLLRTPTVQLARQGVRTGKIMASAERIVDLTQPAQDPSVGTEELHLAFDSHLLLDAIKVRSRRSLGRRRRLGPITLDIASGEMVLLTGKGASGKSTLLRVLAGRQRIASGAIMLDGVDVSKLTKSPEYRRLIAHVPEENAWPRCRLREYLGLSSADGPSELQPLLEAFRLHRRIRQLPDGLDSVVDSRDFSATERSAFGALRVALSDASLLLLDRPMISTTKQPVRRILEGIRSVKPEATIIIALDRANDVELFDQVIHLEQGRIVSAESVDVLTVEHGEEQRSPETVSAI